MFYARPLHLAVLKGNAEIVKFLLSCDAIDVNLLCQIKNYEFKIIFQNRFDFLITFQNHAFFKRSSNLKIELHSK